MEEEESNQKGLAASRPYAPPQHALLLFPPFSGAPWGARILILLLAVFFYLGLLEDD